MEESRQSFRYQFPETTKTISTDKNGERLIPIDISNGGVGFYAERKFRKGSIEEFNLMDFISISIKVNNCTSIEGGGEKSGTLLYKVGAEFVDFTLTPQKLIEFLELHMLK